MQQRREVGELCDTVKTCLAGRASSERVSATERRNSFSFQSLFFLKTWPGVTDGNLIYETIWTPAQQLGAPQLIQNKV